MSDINVDKELYQTKIQLNKRIEELEDKLLEKELGEKLLAASEKRYRRLFESAWDGILILDAETGKVDDVNPYLLKLLGYPYDALFGKHIWELGVFKDIASSKEAFKILQDTEYIRYEDLPLETKDGRAIDVEFVSNVYLVDNSKVIQCNIRDITERRKSERALAESEAKMRNIMDNIGIGVALISPQMEVIELNQKMHDWFPNTDPNEHPICYRAFSDPPRETLCDKCPTKMTLLDGLVHEETVEIPLDGSVFNYRIISSPVFNNSGEVTSVIEMVEDITEKLSLESQFRQAQKMEAVGLLAGGVAHDYNNMLSVILGFTELAMTKVDLEKPLYADLEQIFKAAMRSADITRQLLSFARNQTVAPVVLSLNRNVEVMLKMLRRLIGEDIELTWLPGKDLCRIKMDPVQVDQILANLCVNARDAISGVGKIIIETGNAVFDATYCANHFGFLEGEYVLMAVSDDGCGMDKDMVDQIFEPFFTSKGVGRGTGLGLSMVYGIVKQNNGFINVYSEPGTGTTFRIYLPVYEGKIGGARSEKVMKTPLGHGETVMVVEDEPALMMLTKMMLEKLKYSVLTAGTPDEAISLADEHEGEIQLVITDVVMPGMNGRELSERLQALYSDMRILFMSGYTADVIAHRGVLNEDVNFIQKPFSMKDLSIKVRSAMDDNIQN